MTPLYTAVATTRGGGRNGGHGETADGRLKLDFSMPESLGGPGGQGANPEQLVALGYSACFGSALAFVAGRKHVTLENPSVTCKVEMGRDETGGFAFAFEIVADLPNLTRAEADALVAEAHQVCPYSNAFRNGAPTKATARGGR
jgi:Ohr subfamily peroxiredoxin